MLHEMYVNATQRLTMLFGLSAIIAFALFAQPWPGEHGWQALGLIALWAAICAAVFAFADRWLGAMQTLFLLSFAGMNLLFAWALGESSLVVLAFAGPWLAVMLINWQAGTAALVGLTLLTAYGARAGFLIFPLTVTGAALPAISAILTLAGWIVVHGLRETGAGAMKELNDARVQVENARAQQVELKQIEEDLLHANREQRRLLNRLDALNKIAEEARQTKQTFIANVSHELRTPLNMIIAYSELITQSPHIYGHLPAPLLADMAVIQRNGQHLSRLIDDVLDLSQIETGRMALSKEWTDFEECVREAIATVKPLFASKKLQLELEVTDELPELFCDRTRVRQVIINLLSNAGRFTEHGGVQIRIWLNNSTAMLSVADTGPGIADEVQNRLFEPFQQLDSSIRRKYGGSGLGLNISKQFIEMHEGSVWFESNLGQGTTFFVSLPIKPKATAPVEASGDRRWITPFHEYYQRSRRRVAKLPQVSPRYVVLDEANTLQRLLSRYIEDIELVSTHTPAEALQRLHETPAFAFVVNLASLQQEETIAAIPNTLPFDTPFVSCWLTSHDSIEQLGIVKYIVKPVDNAALLAAVRTLPQPVKTILVADDEPDLLRLFTRLLSGTPEKYRVISASNGAEALMLLRQSRPDLLILDLIMPQMSGFDLLKAKAAEATVRDIPVIVVSSRDPNSQPIVSNQFSISRGSGLSMRDLLACIEALTNVLTPTSHRTPEALTTTPAAQ